MVALHDPQNLDDEGDAETRWRDGDLYRSSGTFPPRNAHG